ncbi:hypothetical protein SYNPS1DRAFT_22161 [Syncephalis pseudoplumigaleata]|uniref:Mediator of RNA polymerase II transcription subunit 9 n=1 Tax=Syncephalis pseudoplumigaleata TaxID=1712513 RepID=A0A4P9Z0Z2_9FUNG|nr:hypothetical protein SYNPS1DRAFT_22161 [Syncephalis pseudoplumigaleata]|eukprot:RKP25978.1 hypothetical protein SYNPS1DRAFT_22161 [Syncephalis pseudoplumigaleata]
MPTAVSPTAVARSASTHSLPSRTGQPAFRREQFQFLPRIAHILDLIASDGSTIEIAKATAELNDNFQRCLQILESLPGADLTREDQQQRLAERTAELAQKREQLDTYAKLATLNWSIATPKTDAPVKAEPGMQQEPPTHPDADASAPSAMAVEEAGASTANDIDPIVSIMDEDDDIDI